VNNTATQKGGAIYYDEYRPMMQNITFLNNSAPYGDNIASYPYQIVDLETLKNHFSIDDVASGQVYSKEHLDLILIDADGQTVNNVNSGRMVIKPFTNGTNVLGTTSVPIVKGIAQFKDVIFIGKPGSQRVLFSVANQASDARVFNEVFGARNLITNFDVNFRYWKPGEADTNNEWSECTSGSYTLEWNTTEWKEWMDNADWLGGIEIHVDKGYWRSSLNSTAMIEWLREEAWEGGYYPEHQYPVKCQKGYKGVLCTDWIVSNGEKYERLANYEWSKCPDPVMNAIRILGLVCLVSSFMIIMVIIGIKKKKESQQSILLRILTNYLQLLTAALSFNLKFPDTLTELFYPLERIGSSSEAFLSFDWFLRDTEVKAFTPSVAIFKIFLTGLLPNSCFSWSSNMVSTVRYF